MTGSGEKMDSCSFQKKSCYFSVLSYVWVPSVCMLATCYCYRTGTIQLMEIPEMLSYHLALVPTMLILTLDEVHIFPSHLEPQFVGGIRAVIFQSLVRCAKPTIFWGSLRILQTWAYFVFFSFLCYPLQVLQPEKKKRGEDAQQFWKTDDFSFGMSESLYRFCIRHGHCEPWFIKCSSS